MKRFNLNSHEAAVDDDDPEGYDGAYARFGPQIGASRIGGSVYHLDPGQSICPYHYELGDEEWAIVLEGRPTVRHPGGEELLEPGDVVCFPAGPEGAHKITNAGDAAGTARIFMVSTLQQPSVAIYPDSDKVGVFDEGLRLLVPRDAGVDYWQGER